MRNMRNIAKWTTNIPSWLMLSTALGLERLDVGAPGAAWELKFSLWGVKNQLSIRKQRQANEKEHAKNGKQTLFYLMHTKTTPGRN